ncbi:protein phosphatase 1 regulatory subunit 36-like [Lucilia cuprina]|uniref:protein phosphatase 1 regulatory subunit 36-like n=1 Tax=Lucilia cuprina TaxID=7375 RepID=UPI001F068C0D|nr:protein phosphatase 1 regulatory subunit 36-like [Lucilia cuprina]
MIRIHTDNFVPRYVNGTWIWNDDEENLHFDSREEASKEVSKEEYINIGGYKFLATINQLEEMIFRQEFQRPDTTHDYEAVLLQDIKDLVMFLSPKEILTKDFIYFLNTKTVHQFLKALVIYFEYFLKFVEFILIRRDEIRGEKAQIQSEESTEIKRIYSKHLSQYRLILAREYSEILLGNGEMRKFYHLKPIVNISQSIKDKAFHEGFLAFCTNFVWIAMFRRDLELIDMEMNRLFRSEHFSLVRCERYQFSPVEASMLYGKNYKRCNYRAQNSPLIMELMNVEKENVPLLWIGERKYRGTDLCIFQIELEFIVPDSQLSLIDVSHGILGHPRKIYDTMLTINWEAVRFQNYSELYDPYRIIRQPYLEIPKLDEENLRKNCEKYESYYQLKHSFEGWDRKMLRKWLKRDEIINFFKTEGILTDVWQKCQKELEHIGYGPSVEEITKKFIARKEKLRKKK